jgi:hypothetical protein
MFPRNSRPAEAPAFASLKAGSEMRAEIIGMADEIKQGITLLRRHL